MAAPEVPKRRWQTNLDRARSKKSKYGRVYASAAM